MENRNDIWSELKELSPTIAAIEKINPFTVPRGYFNHLANDIFTGIVNEKGSHPNSFAVTDVPAGYFDSLAGSILTKIKAEESPDAATEIIRLSPQLFRIKNKPVFEVPPGYFDTLNSSILTKINIEDTEDAATEIMSLSPMLYGIKNEPVFEVPQGYFKNVGNEVLAKVKPQAKVIAIKSRSRTFFKYAVAAAFTGVMALGVLKFTENKNRDTVLPVYVTAGLQVQNIDKELANISDADIAKYLESTGTDVKAAMVANSIDKNDLPSQEDYLLDEQALDKYLQSIKVDEFKN